MPELLADLPAVGARLVDAAAWLQTSPPAGLLRGPVGLDTWPGPARIIASPAGAAALGAGVLTCLFLLLFVYRRRVYILHWTASWALMAVSLLLTARAYDDRPLARVMLGLSQLLAVAASLLLVLSADTRARRLALRWRHLLGLLPLVIWFSLAPLVLGRRAVLVPGYLMSAGVLASAALAFLQVLRRARLLGAGLVGGALLLLASSQAWIALATSRTSIANEIPLFVLVLNAMLYLFSALGMHLLVFEEMTYELRVANREISAAQAELRQLAITDALTGCHNRRFFEEVIGRELERQQRYQIPLALLFIDVDRFKEINDRLGHDTGDRVLQAVADLLQRQVRHADYVFRWGGDEFVALMACTMSQARRKGAELKAAFAASRDALGLPEGVGLSVGYAEVPPDAADVASIVRQADVMMYQDKLGA